VNLARARRIIIALMVSAGGCSTPHLAQVDPSPSGALAELLAADFAGVMHRGSRVAASPRSESAMPWHQNALYQCTGDPSVVVSSYAVGPQDVVGERARVTVTFCRVGRIDGLMTNPVREDSAAEVVQYELRREGRQWAVVSPLLARVGVTGLRACLEAEFAHLPSTWEQTASKGEIASRGRAKTVLAVFPESLAGVGCPSRSVP
jgi:hypothetical protein